MMTKIITWNQFLWGGPLLFVLISLHLYFTFRSHVVQRHLGRALKLSFSGFVPEDSSATASDDTTHSATPPARNSILLALTTTLAATLGTGNIIGMSTAIALGGPGAVFWCWLTGVLGMATTYAECNLSLHFVHAKHGEFGPMSLLRDVQKKPFLAAVFAAALLAVSLGMSATIQSNALSQSACSLFPSLSPLAVGLILMCLAAYVFFGHSNRLERVCMTLVPAMSIFFLLGCLTLCLLYVKWLPTSLLEIVKGAFGHGRLPARQLLGGFAGYRVAIAMRQGVAKGLFTNEAGLGTAALAATMNKTSKPINQALVSMSATFFDTVVLCALTGIMLVACMFGSPAAFAGVGNGELINAAFGLLPLFGTSMLHVSIITFAFATLLGWYYFGKKAADFLAGTSGIHVYRFAYLFMIVIGSVASRSVIWELADFLNIFLLLPNLCLLWSMRRSITYP